MYDIEKGLLLRFDIMPLLLHEWVRTLAVSVRYRTKVILADADDALIIHWVVALEDFIFKGVLSLSGSAGGWTWQRWVAQTSLTFSSAKWNKKSFMYCRDVTNSKTFLNLYVQCNTSNFGKMFLFNYCILGFGRTRIETLYIPQLVNVVCKTMSIMVQSVQIVINAWWLPSLFDYCGCVNVRLALLDRVGKCLPLFTKCKKRTSIYISTYVYK